MKYKKTIIVSVVVLAVTFLLIALFNSTYALFASDTVSENSNVYSTGMLMIEATSLSENISLSNALPMTDEAGLESTPYVFNIKNVGNLDFEFDIKLLSTDNSSNSFSPEYIKLQIDDGEVVTLASIGSVIKNDVTLSAGASMNISLRIWLSIDTPNTELGKSFNSKIVADGKAVYTNTNNYLNVTVADYISNLYNISEHTTITHSSTGKKYNYATSVGLMNDGMDSVGNDTVSKNDGNIRYYGKNPNNYIYFNCTDYSDTSTCEKWRIIGVFDDKVKIIRDSSLGDLAWDNKTSGIGSSKSAKGSTDWTDSRLMMLLNPGYESGSDVYDYEGSLYWNSKSGTCYSGQSNATSTCNFTNTGLKNDVTRNMIADVTWNLGGNGSSVYANQMYTFEKTGNTPYSRPTTWNGKIGLMHVSDYGFAADLSSCTNNLNTYNKCKSTNWLHTGVFQWTLTVYPKTTQSHYALNIFDGGGVGHYEKPVYTPLSVRPVVYLESDTIMGGGTGNSSDPYQIELSYLIKESLNLGDYIYYKPVVESYDTDTSKTNNNYVATIYPSELTLWRVLFINEDGTVDLISENISSTSVTFAGKLGYQNLVGYLNELASQYETERITVSSRHFGYNGQTEYITDTSMFTKDSHYKCSTGGSCNPEESKGGGDNLYERDYEQVKNVLGTAAAYRVGGTKTSPYWIASRYYSYGPNWLSRRVESDGRVYNSYVFFDFIGTGGVGAVNSFLRPIVTLKSGLSYVGLGTKDSPVMIISS